MKGKEMKQGFWKSLPGILTQVVALIVALGSLWHLLGPWLGISREEVRATQQISPKEAWHDTGLWISPGDTIAIAADGLWTLSDETHGNYKSTGAEGWTWAGLQARDPDANPHLFPEPNTAPGALLGRIGTGGKIFFVGKHIDKQYDDAEGKLYLGINDTRLDDNAGCIEVLIRQGNLKK